MNNQEKNFQFEVRGDVGAMSITGNAFKEDWDKFNEIANAWQDATVEYEKQLAKKLGVSETCVGMICYIRTRSRYTPEMEQRLIDMDKKGEAIPVNDILSGEWYDGEEN